MNEQAAYMQKLIDNVTRPLTFGALLLSSTPESQLQYHSETKLIPKRCAVFEKVQLSGISVTVMNNENHPICAVCSHREECSITTAVFSPMQLHSVNSAVVVTFPKDTQGLDLFHQNIHQIAEYTYSLCELIGSKLVVKDITHETQMLKKEIGAFLTLSADAVVVVNAEGLILEANQHFCNLSQQSHFQLIGMTITEFFTERDWNSIRRGKDVEQIQMKINREKNWKLKWKHIYDTGKLFSVIIQVHEEKSTVTKQRMHKRPLHTINDIKGNSAVIKSAKEMVNRIAQSDTTIMIRGESGTGKEVFAQAIHSLSPRCNASFVAINCAAIPESLLESELFGYEGGAFTGARGDGKAGRFELAHGGTIFLDEIGDMSLHLQAKLLRVVQEKKVERIGGTYSIDVDVRIIAATHRNLERLVAEEKFREDLYYRLNVIPLTVPPLRERKDDIPLLIEHFMKKFSKDLNRLPKQLSTQVLEKLLHYKWPGNIRELENVVEHFVQLEIGDLVTMHSLPQQIREHSISPAAPTKRENSRQTTSRLEKETILELLDQLGRDTDGKRKVAEKMGISLPTLYRKIQRLKIR